MPRPKTPELTADIIIEMELDDIQGIVLIERKYEPFGWALPGGFVDVGETLEHAAIREAKEETCLDVQLMHLLGCYSNPKRDHRGHTVSAVYIATATGNPKAEDDAKNIGVFDPNQLSMTLAFDHATIIEDYLHFKQRGDPTPLRV